MWNQRLTYPSDLDEMLECDTKLNKNLMRFGDPQNPKVGSINYISIYYYSIHEGEHNNSHLGSFQKIRIIFKRSKQIKLTNKTKQRGKQT